MPESLVRLCASFALLACFGAGCTSSGLSGGGGGSNGSKKEDSGKSGTATDSASGNGTSTDTDHEVGGNDAGDFAFPEDVAGAYLTCQYATSMPGSAQFGCRVFVGGAPDPRQISGVKQGTLLGADANAVTSMTAAPDPSDPGRIVLRLVGSGKATTTQPVEFDASLDITYSDGSTSTVESPYTLYVPDVVYKATGCPDAYVGDAKVLADGRTFTVCTATKGGGGGSIEAMWTRFPGTDAPDYTPVFVPEDAGQCDVLRREPASFTACACAVEDDWIKGTVSLPTSGNPFPGSGICLVVETQLDIFGKLRTIFSLSH